MDKNDTKSDTAEDITILREHTDFMKIQCCLSEFHVHFAHSQTFFFS